MKLVKGQASGYPMPPHSYIAGVWTYTDGDPRFNTGSYRIALRLVDPFHMARARDEIEKEGRSLTGRPDAVTVHHDSTLEFFPTPDKDYEVFIRYAGPWQEI